MRLETLLAHMCPIVWAWVAAATPLAGRPRKTDLPSIRIGHVHALCVLDRVVLLLALALCLASLASAPRLP